MNLDIDLRQHWKLIVVIVAAAALLALVITVISASISNRRRAAMEELQQMQEEQVQVPVSLIDELELRPEAMMLGTSLRFFWLGEYRPLYEQKSQWDMNDLRLYFYDPREIGGESLRSVNSEIIDSMLSAYR